MVQEGLGRLVQRLRALGLGGLHHQGLVDDEGEVHGGRMDAVVQQRLGHVHGGDAGLVLQVLQGHDELVHAQAGVGHVIAVRQLLHQVVGVEHRARGGLGDALLAQGEEVGQGLHHHQEVAVEGLAPGRWSGPAARSGSSLRLCTTVGAGRKGAKKRLAAHRAAAGAAAAVGGGEGLVQVQVDHVKAHVARAGRRP